MANLSFYWLCIWAYSGDNFMRINLAKSAGFCFGVKRAIDIAQRLALLNKKVFMLGDIVHNEEVSQKLNRLGIRKIKRLGYGRGKILLIRAHGAGRDIFAKAQKRGYKIVDATCPMVKEIHRIAKKEDNKKRRVIIIGDSNHDEVLGIAGQLKTKALIIDPKRKIDVRKVKQIKKASVVVQSTQDMEKVERIRVILEKWVKDLKFFNTICKPTRIKQKEMKNLPRESDLVLIIGSKTSANTKRLYEIAKKINKNSYWISNEKEIKPEWFKGINSVGITAGASTPEETIKEVLEYLQEVR
ncbi:MAG: 4-hydroxy-3-methylbut-2-enyl diphosphate reductase [Candidatus Omnitrophica bacterium]|nr:4-hydroxy-3-methylbut-2-enyl diphosphate reductase [Candidatus Omnitrophota bacterium]